MAGEFTISARLSYDFGSFTVGGTVDSIICDGKTSISKTIPANSTNAEIDVVVDVSTVVVAAIEANKNCTVKTNSTSAPDDTLTLLANKAVGWKTNDVASLFLTADVTKLYVTTGAEATIIKFGVGYDATPAL